MASACRSSRMAILVRTKPAYSGHEAGIGVKLAQYRLLIRKTVRYRASAARFYEKDAVIANTAAGNENALPFSLSCRQPASRMQEGMAFEECASRGRSITRRKSALR